MTGKNHKYLISTPWDSRIFGIDTYEIRALSPEAMERTLALKGHFTIKVDPLSSKELLDKYGFYYCDTLIEPYCARENFVHFEHEKAAISKSVDIDELIAISHGAFSGRFHRDFNIDKNLADLRYDTWLRDLYGKKGVFGLIFDRELAGFFGFSGNKIHLHAISKKYKGKGLAKYLWSRACRELFGRGFGELTSSISTSNRPAFNLYRSLGFKFRNSLDVYHRLAL